MEEMFKENQLRIRNKKKEQLKKIKKEQAKENILFTFILGFICVATIMLLCNMNNKQTNNCIKLYELLRYAKRLLGWVQNGL